MALFTDGPISSIDDLAARDSQLLSVASVEGIDVTQKIKLAQDEIELEIKTLLKGASHGYWCAGDPDLGPVVVTPALKMWHALRSLELVYGDAFNSQLNDRYAGKRDQFHEMAKGAYEKLVDTGLGIAACPVAQASAPTAATSSGVALPDGTYFVTTGWVNAQGEEGACAVPTTLTTSTCTLAVKAGAPPANAAGWNVYVGWGPDELYRQNVAAIDPGATWLQPPVVGTSGAAPGTGQSPTYWKPVPRILQRG